MLDWRAGLDMIRSAARSAARRARRGAPRGRSGAPLQRADFRAQITVLVLSGPLNRPNSEPKIPHHKHPNAVFPCVFLCASAVKSTKALSGEYVRPLTNSVGITNRHLS